MANARLQKPTSAHASSIKRNPTAKNSQKVLSGVGKSEHMLRKPVAKFNRKRIVARADKPAGPRLSCLGSISWRLWVSATIVAISATTWSSLEQVCCRSCSITYAELLVLESPNHVQQRGLQMYLLLGWLRPTAYHCTASLIIFSYNTRFRCPETNFFNSSSISSGYQSTCGLSKSLRLVSRSLVFVYGITTSHVPKRILYC